MPTTIITGGGTGIGSAAARLLASRGHRVAIVGRRADKLSEVAGTIRATGGDCLTIAADIADPAVPARAVAETVAAFGELTGLVNNAATIKTEALTETTPTVATLDHHWAVNIRAPYLFTQAALPHLLAAKGAVVNISSSSGTLVVPGQSVYGMTKHAIEYLTRSFAAEFASRRVRCNCIAFGPVDTPIHETWATDLVAAYAWLNEQVPLGRIASADEAAWFIGMFLSPEADWLTGVVLPVDGGQVLDAG